MAIAGYIVHDTISIMGIGASEDAAWSDYMTAAGLAERDGCECVPADAGLLAMAKQQGGCGLSWTLVDGVATVRGDD